MKYFNLILIILIVSCNSKHTDPLLSSQGVDSVQTKENLKLEITSLNCLDSIISVDFFLRNLKEWYQYQQSHNPKFSLDSFILSENKPFDIMMESFYFNNKFSNDYKYILSYSPDQSKVLDLFSSQIKLEKLSNGKYGGLYTILGDPFLIIPSKKARLRLLFYETSDQFHDSFWLNNSIVIVTGTTSSKSA